MTKEEHTKILGYIQNSLTAVLDYLEKLIYKRRLCPNVL